MAITLAERNRHINEAIQRAEAQGYRFLPDSLPKPEPLATFEKVAEGLNKVLEPGEPPLTAADAERIYDTAMHKIRISLLPIKKQRHIVVAKVRSGK